MTKDRQTTDPGIAIVGIGALFPDSPSLKEYWRLISRGEDAIIDVPDTHWSAADYFRENPAGGDYVYCKRGGFLPSIPYDPTEFNIPPNVMEATDTSQLLGLLVAKRALEDAGYGEDNTTWDRERTGVILGATGTQELVIPLASRLGFPKWRKALEKAGVPAEQAEYVIEQIAHDHVPWQESSFPGLLGNVIAGRIANRFDLGGTNCVIDAACASSLSAINLAVLELITGRADMMITGGVDTLNDIFMHMCFSKTSVLSFSGDARPFSKDADGTVLGEGIGLFVLKRLEDAERDNNKIYAILEAVGTASDGRSAGIYAPVAKGQMRALRRAYDKAGIDPATVEMVEAHGTGTRVGDAVEFEALAGVFREADATPGRCALGSVKSMIGHTKAAAGSASMAKVALALYHKVIPPTLKVDEPDPKLDIDNSPFYISTTLRPWFSDKKQPRRAGLSSFGFGGSNFHMVMSEYQPEKPEPAWDGSVEIIAVSGATKAKVVDQLNAFTDTIATHAQKEGGLFRGVGLHAPATREAFDPAHRHRAMIILERSDDVMAVIRECIDALAVSEEGLINGKHLVYGTAEEKHAAPTGRTAFIFPGQGSQYVYMARDLVTLFPEAHRIFEVADAQFAKFRNADDKPLSDYVFPSGFREGNKKAAEETLRSTDIAQPAIGAASLAMARVLQRFNITADAACGHSFGELTALCAAGWMDEEAFLSLAAARGKYMAAAGKEKGAMLAVKGDLESIEKLIFEHGLDLVLANRNSPDQGVLSGREPEIDRAAAICKENRMRATKLPVSAAFHTKLVQDAAKPFREYLRKKELTCTDIPVFSNTTGGAYPADPGEARKLLGAQILNPVNFIDEILTMYAEGIDTFLEIGPKTVLTGLVKTILKGKPFSALSVDASGGRKFGVRDLAQTLCFFAATGHPVLLHNWETMPIKPPREQKMSIPLCGANYIKDRPPLPDKSFAPPVAAVSASEPPPPRSEPVSVSADSFMVKDALKVVSDSLKSMQALQQQTADAHRRFLDTQTEAGRALGVVMEKTRSLSESVLGGRRIGPASRPVLAPEAERHAQQMAAVAQPPAPAVAPSPAQTPKSGPVPPAPTFSPQPSYETRGIDAGLIESAMLDIVSRVTGYPVDMLTLDMDIENDLGIDSIKRVEILSLFEEEQPDIPSAAPEDLAEMRTMGEICRHLIGLAGATAGTAVPVPSPEAGVSAPAIESAMLDIVSRVTGYPVDMLTLDMDIENDLGIDSIKRVEILSLFEEEQPDIPSAAPEDLAEMRTMGEICRHLIGLAGATAGTAAPVPSVEAGVSAPAIESAMLDIVSRVTGYPVDMLTLDMDIENDLGIDSIKRVDILSLFEEEQPDIPSAAPEDLAEMRTMGEICRHLIGLAGGTAGTDAPGPSPEAGVSAPAIESAMLDIVSRVTGYPVDMLTLDMDIENDLGIDSIKRVEILSVFEEEHPDIPSAAPEDLAEMRTMGEICRHLIDLAGGDAPAATVAAEKPISDTDVFTADARTDAPVPRRSIRLSEMPLKTADKVALPADAPIFICGNSPAWSRAIGDSLERQGMTVSVLEDLSAMPDMSSAGGLVITVDMPVSEGELWTETDEGFIKDAFEWVTRAAGHLSGMKGPGKHGIFAAVTTMDGQLGFGGGTFNPMQAALSGLVKTAAIEWDAVACRFVDVAPSWKDDPLAADAVADELLNAGGPVEVGLSESSRCGITLEPADYPEGKPDLGPDDVIVVSGGARGVTAQCAIALAETTGAAMVLLGRSPLPAPEPEWLNGLTHAPDIKKVIMENLFAGQKPTPVEIDRHYRRYMAAREIEANMEALNRLSRKVLYYPVDVRDAGAVRKVIDDVRESIGPIGGIIHGAGVLEDRFIVDKTRDQFEKVFDTKVSGLKSLLSATAQDPLRYIVLFSSVSARMGNKGQVDYAMANEVLNKTAQRLAFTLPDCRTVSINWGPWDGGMVTPSLRREFEKNNIRMIPLAAGARCMISEMAGQPGVDTEIVIGAGFSDVEAEAGKKPAVPLPSKKKNGLSTAFEQEISLDRLPVLKAHQLDGIPVVPFALAFEWIGSGALHANPGLVLTGINNMRVMAGIKLNGTESSIAVLAGKPRKKGAAYEVDVEIRNTGASGDMLYYAASVVLSPDYDAPPSFSMPPDLSDRTFGRTQADIYDTILFHGKDLYGIQTVMACTEGGISGVLSSAPEPRQWIKEPMRNVWLADPLVLDAAFQMAIVWCHENAGMVSLPVAFGAFRQYRPAFPTDGVRGVLEVKSRSSQRIQGDFTFLDADSRVIATMNGYEAVMDKSLAASFKK